MNRRRIIAICTTTAFAVGAALSIAPSPAAAAAPSNCANTSLCGYGQPNYWTAEGYEYYPAGPGACENVSLANQWTSVYNNGGRTVRLYKSRGCTGGVWTLNSGSGLANMNLYQPSWNDNIESIRW